MSNPLWARLRIAGLIAPLLLVSLACNDKETNPVVLPDLSSPQAVFEALQEAYRTRDTALYQELLAPEFTFRFQPVDAAELETDTWTREDDLLGTEALFRSPDVRKIDIELVALEATQPSEVQFAEDVQMIRVTQTALTVLESRDAFLVYDQQDFFFRPGHEADGEDPGRWYLLEWRDLAPSGSADIRDRLPVRGITWGSLKLRYL